MDYWDGVRAKLRAASKLASTRESVSVRLDEVHPSRFVAANATMWFVVSGIFYPLEVMKTRMQVNRVVVPGQSIFAATRAELR
jgi:hypothetical protein